MGIKKTATLVHGDTKTKRNESQENKGQLYSSDILCHLQSELWREGVALPRIRVWMEGSVSNS